MPWIDHEHEHEIMPLIYGLGLGLSMFTPALGKWALIADLGWWLMAWHGLSCYWPRRCWQRCRY